jgi:hypothetical protein
MNHLKTARRGIVGLAIGALIVVSGAAIAQQRPAVPSDDAYLAKVGTAAPIDVVKASTIVAMDKNGTSRTLQKGTNDFTCMVMADGTPMCADKNGMEWAHALMTHSAPPANKIGFMYMLNGDIGASNTDPYATAATASNHWVKTGPHVMILGPASKTLGYPRTADANPATPYVMWADTPYEHVMIPVTLSSSTQK